MHKNNAKRRHIDLDERRLIADIQARVPGWKDLFGQLVDGHQGAPFGRCLAYLKNHDDAADASQETLFRAYRALDSFKGEAAFRTWLFAIADNQCHTLARKHSRVVLSDDMENLAGVVVLEPVRVITEPDNTATEVVHQALAQITPLGRDVLQLRYFGDLSIEDIATTLGVGISAAKMRLYRAQEQVASLIRADALECAA